MRTPVYLAVGLLMCGCASTQLNYNALDLAGTVDDLITRQISHNIANYIDNPRSIPTQVSIASGSVTTTGQLSASYTLPINKAFTLTHQAVAAASPSITNITSAVATSSSIAPSAVDQFSQNWGLVPYTESDPVRRLGTLYRYITHPNTFNFCAEYPVIATQGSRSAKKRT